MSEQFIKQTLIKEQKRIADLKYQTKKRLEKLRRGGFKHQVNYTEQDLLDIIADCDKKLDTKGSRGRTKFTLETYPKIDEYLKWNNQICI